MKNEKRKAAKKRDYRKEMLEAEFYNYKPIPRYNHHTGWVDGRCDSPHERVIDPINVKLNIAE